MTTARGKSHVGDGGSFKIACYSSFEVVLDFPRFNVD